MIFSVGSSDGVSSPKIQNRRFFSGAAVFKVSFLDSLEHYPPLLSLMLSN
jgi:hypothetical protein